MEPFCKIQPVSFVASGVFSTGDGILLLIASGPPVSGEFGGEVISDDSIGSLFFGIELVLFLVEPFDEFIVIRDGAIIAAPRQRRL